MSNDRRVVVTGLGAVSSIGIGWEEFWKNLLAGKSGISKVKAFDTSDYPNQYAGEIKNFISSDYFNQKKAYQLGRASQFAIVASRLALKDAKIPLKGLRKQNISICLGTTMGEGQVIEQIVKHSLKKTNSDVKRIRAMAYPASNIASNLAHELGINNRNIIFSNACAAGNYAVGYAYDLIRSGKADCIIAGGVDALSRIAFTGFGRLFAMAPEKCCPFDKNRQGMMLGEGGAMLVLESIESASKRKASIYAEIRGYGLSCDANHMTHPDSHGVAKGIKKAIKSAGISGKDIDYISAHGTGTRENDRAECKAYEDALGLISKKIPASSIKSMLGHTMGAASAFESIACCLAIKYGQIPPTINFKEHDPECEIDCVSEGARKGLYKTVLNNSQAFGGNNACIVFSLREL